MHPLIEEFNRIPGLNACQPTFFRAVQRRLREEIQPLLDERDALLLRVVQLETELARTKGKKPAPVVEVRA